MLLSTGNTNPEWNYIQSANIANAQITNSKMASDSVGTSQLINDSVTNAKVLNNTLTIQKFSLPKDSRQLYVNPVLGVDDVDSGTILRPFASIGYALSFIGSTNGYVVNIVGNTSGDIVINNMLQVVLKWNNSGVANSSNCVHTGKITISGNSSSIKICDV